MKFMASGLWQVAKVVQNGGCVKFGKAFLDKFGAYRSMFFYQESGVIAFF